MTNKLENIKFTICQIGAFHGAAGKTPSNADSLKESLRQIGIETIWSSRHTNRLLRVSDMFFTLLLNSGNYRVVLLHIYSGPAFGWAVMTAIIAKFLGKKLILWLHGGNLPGYYKNHTRPVDFVFRRADYIISPSLYLAQAFENKYEVEILPYELPIKSYPHRERGTIKPRLFWLRAFNAGYNPLMAVEVVKKLKPKYPDIFLKMCGPDTSDDSFRKTKQYAADEGVESNIEFPGLISKEEIKRCGIECDIFLNTTNYDNTPVSVIEAMAMGMCVVTTNVGGIPYLVKDGESGLTVPAGDGQAMAEACDRIIQNPELSRSLSRNARKKAEEFEWENLAPRWQKIISQLDLSDKSY